MAEVQYLVNDRLDVVEFLTLVEEEYPDQARVEYYKRACDARTQRFGQAFMNALRGTPYYMELTGTIYDPFYKHSYEANMAAINWLMSK
jgi:hypothetical protein